MRPLIGVRLLKQFIASIQRRGASASPNDGVTADLEADNSQTNGAHNPQCEEGLEQAKFRDSQGKQTVQLPQLSDRADRQ